MCESRSEFLAGLERLVSGLDADAMTGEHAKELVRWFSRLEHLAAAGKDAVCRAGGRHGVVRRGGQPQRRQLARDRDR
jgi:hypothetical protein